MKLAIIPARGGSQRIPRKNMREFCGKPMLAWPLEAALASGCFDQVIVSTDDDEIAAVARKHGARVPFMRPQSLAGDFTGTNAVVVHAIEHFAAAGERVEAVACIYATAVFLTTDHIRAGMELLQLNPDRDFSLTVTRYPFPIQRSLGVATNGELSLREPEHALSRSQDLQVFYHDAGQLYCGHADSFRRYPSVLQGRMSPIFLHPNHVQDIDTPEDWERAELIFKMLRREQP